MSTVVGCCDTFVLVVPDRKTVDAPDHPVLVVDCGDANDADTCDDTDDRTVCNTVQPPLRRGASPCY